MFSQFSRLILSLSVCIPLFCGALGAGAQDEPVHVIKATYVVTLIGLEIGRADLHLTFTDQTYLGTVVARVTGIATLLGSSTTQAEASGQILNHRLVPENYAVVANNAQLTRTVRMSLPQGAVKSVEVEPPVDDRADRVPLREGDKTNIMDPLTSLLSLVLFANFANDAELGQEVCAPTLPVFDGFTRYDIHLAYSGEKNVKAPSFTGLAAICKARYAPIAGHRPDRPATKFMADNKNMEIWFIPLKSMAIPVKIAVLTMIGTINITLTAIDIS